MKTQRQIFRNYLKKEGFHLSPVLSTIQRVPHLYKDIKGNHNLVTDINCCTYDGINTKPGDLGCVVFDYSGTQRRKYCRYVNQAGFLIKSFCPKTAAEAIKAFEIWRIESRQTIKSWTLIQ